MRPYLHRNDDDAFGGESSAVPARGTELSCLSLGQSASSGPWPSSSPLFPSTLELFEDDREECELLGDVPGMLFKTIMH